MSCAATGSRAYHGHRVSFEWHDLSKRAKDLASAAVFLSLMLCGGVWCADLWHRFAQ